MSVPGGRGRCGGAARAAPASDTDPELWVPGPLLSRDSIQAWHVPGLLVTLGKWWPRTIGQGAHWTCVQTAAQGSAGLRKGSLRPSGQLEAQDDRRVV